MLVLRTTPNGRQYYEINCSVAGALPSTKNHQGGIQDDEDESDAKDVWTSRFGEMSSADRQKLSSSFKSWRRLFLPEASSAQCRKVQSWSWRNYGSAILH